MHFLKNDKGKTHIVELPHVSNLKFIFIALNLWMDCFLYCELVILIRSLCVPSSS